MRIRYANTCGFSDCVSAVRIRVRYVNACPLCELLSVMQMRVWSRTCMTAAHSNGGRAFAPEVFSAIRGYSREQRVCGRPQSDHTTPARPHTRPRSACGSMRSPGSLRTVISREIEAHHVVPRPHCICIFNHNVRVSRVLQRGHALPSHTLMHTRMPWPLLWRHRCCVVAIPITDTHSLSGLIFSQRTHLHSGYAFT